MFLKDSALWQVSYYAKTRKGEPRKEIAQVIVGDRSGGIVELWTGFRVAWTMARGYDGAFGKKVNAPYVWIPLLVLFVVPFVQWRRPFALLHLDLAVLCAFSLSLAFFNAAEIETSVPLVAPLLAYLLGRMLWIGVRGRRAPPPRLLVPVGWLAVGIIFLAGFRLGLNLVASNVIDVGYAGVIGADRLADGDPLYGGWPQDNEHGDTYGPLAYAAYVPFEQAMPWGGTWDDLPAAHGAAIAFDLLTLVGVWILGRRVGGQALGVALAYAWAAFPFTLYALNTNANDTLVPMLVVATLLVATSAPARGVVAALASLTKLAPFGLAPVLATHGLSGMPWRRRLGRLALFTVPFAAVVALTFLLAVDDVGTFWDRTVAFQADRGAPFSIWGLYDLDVLQRVAQVLAVLVALGVALVPRRADERVRLAALCAAVLIALQLALTYWFYLYVVWFFPLVMLALLGRDRAPARA
ncbi:MAG TPA: glycosyltransferase family 87 protein [Solirubrobacteraceae bacterium]|nr:glycosyltransferase family 87 protein [Solirubrobacteraceae bacterium]